MHKYFSLSAIALVAFLAGCEKSVRITPPHQLIETDQVMFSTKGFGYDVSTKVTAVTELNSFNVLACTGSAGSQANYWGEVVTATKSGDDYLTSKYWASTDPSITSFYASNAALTFNAAGPTVAPDGTVDVVCAHLSSPTYKVKNTLTFDHIYARVGTITLNTQTGYELSAVSATLKDRVSGGTYNLRLGAGHTDGTGWTPGAGSDAAAAVFSGSTSAQTSTNDLYVVPGSYSLQISYTLTKGSYTQTFTKTGSIALVAGKTNNITATAIGGAAAEIKFGVSVTPWSANAIELAWEPDANGHDYVDLGLRVGGNKILFATCNIGAANPQDYGDYFAWGEISKRYTSINGNTVTGATFESSNTPYHTGSSISTGWTKYIPTSKSSCWSGGGDPDNKTVLDLSDDVAHVLWGGDWRMPTAEELCMLINGDGTNITPNAVSNVTYTWTSDYNSTDVAGFLITGKGEYSSASLFLPAAGHCGGSDLSDAGDYGYYWSRSLNIVSPDAAWVLIFEDGAQRRGYVSRYTGQSVRPVLVVPA